MSASYSVHKMLHVHVLWSGAWFLQRDDDILNCFPSSDTSDHSSSNFLVGAFAIANGSTFFFYVLLLGLASVWAFLCCSEAKVLICLLCTIPEIVVTILGLINSFVDAIFTGIHEQCRSAEANGFLLLNCAVVLINGIVALQIIAVVVAGMVLLWNGDWCFYIYILYVILLAALAFFPKLYI